MSGHSADEPVILNIRAGAVDEVEMPTMLWSVEGGIAGFCESIRVSGGSAEIASCEGSVSLASLTPAHAAQVDQWRQQFASFDYTDANEDAVADGMTVQLIFNGTGSAQPTEDDIAVMMDFLWGLLGSQ